jgi:hypothetical protein
MKKQILSLSALLLLAIGAFAFTAKANPTPVPTPPQPVENVDDSLYCKVSDGNVTLTCWFCDCAKLVAQL